MILRMLTVRGLLVLGMILHLPEVRSAEPVAAIIINSGSTNRPGFRIVVNQSGAAEFTSVPRRGMARPEQTTSDQTEPIRATVPRALIEQLYADLRAAKPLTLLPEGHCMKSVSFGSSLLIAFGEEQTPDLSCANGGNAAIANLARDANDIVALFDK